MATAVLQVFAATLLTGPAKTGPPVVMQQRGTEELVDGAL
jgi:hypothetical protein